MDLWKRMSGVINWNHTNSKSLENKPCDIRLKTSSHLKAVPNLYKPGVVMIGFYQNLLLGFLSFFAGFSCVVWNKPHIHQHCKLNWQQISAKPGEDSFFLRVIKSCRSKPVTTSSIGNLQNVKWKRSVAVYWLSLVIKVAKLTVILAAQRKLKTAINHGDREPQKPPLMFIRSLDSSNCQCLWVANAP